MRATGAATCGSRCVSDRGLDALLARGHGVFIEVSAHPVLAMPLTTACAAYRARWLARFAVTLAGWRRFTGTWGCCTRRAMRCRGRRCSPTSPVRWLRCRPMPSSASATGSSRRARSPMSPLPGCRRRRIRCWVLRRRLRAGRRSVHDAAFAGRPSLARRPHGVRQCAASRHAVLELALRGGSGGWL